MDACFQLRKIGIPSSVEKVKNCHQITSSTTLIGRGQAADIFLDSTLRKGLISRAHAQIIQRDVEGAQPQFEIFDTSLNGTYVNDVRINGSVFLKEGDAIAFGHLRGSLIKPGTHAPQKETEFLFRFENCGSEIKSLTGNDLQNTKSSVFMSPKSPPAIVGENVELGTTTYNHEELSPPEKRLKFQTPTIGNSRYTKSDEEDLKRVIENATSKINTPPTDEASSDEGSFVINLDHNEQKTPELPLRNKNLLNHDSSYINSKDSSLISSTNSNDSDVETESESECIDDADSGSERSEEIPDDSSDNEIITERRQTNRRRSNTTYNKNNIKNTTNRNSTRRGRKSLEHDKCDSKNCTIATSNKKTVTWVQCDECDAWYHVSCSGLKVSDVKRKDTIFNCGCS